MTASKIKPAISKSVLLKVEGILTRQQVLSKAQGKGTRCFVQMFIGALISKEKLRAGAVKGSHLPACRLPLENSRPLVSPSGSRCRAAVQVVSETAKGGQTTADSAGSQVGSACHPLWFFDTGPHELGLTGEPQGPTWLCSLSTGVKSKCHIT